MHLRFSLENQTLMLRSDKTIQSFSPEREEKKKAPQMKICHIIWGLKLQGRAQKKLSSNRNTTLKSIVLYHRTL